MSKRALAAKPASTPWWSPGWSWKIWLMVVALLTPTLGFALWVLAEAGGQTKIDPQTLATAAGNADGPVTAITGTEHTVYHSAAPLPDAKAPRSDGKDTLVWFTNQTCARCESMLWVHATMKEYRDAVVTVEKATDRDTADDALKVDGVPYFVMLDPEGNEKGRFTDVADAAALKAQVDRLLQ